MYQLAIKQITCSLRAEIAQTGRIIKPVFDKWRLLTVALSVMKKVILYRPQLDRYVPSRYNTHFLDKRPASCVSSHWAVREPVLGFPICLCNHIPLPWPQSCTSAQCPVKFFHVASLARLCGSGFETVMELNVPWGWIILWLEGGGRVVMGTLLLRETVYVPTVLVLSDMQLSWYKTKIFCGHFFFSMKVWGWFHLFLILYYLLWVVIMSHTFCLPLYILLFKLSQRVCASELWLQTIP